MPSLIPKTQNKTAHAPAFDLREVFASEQTKPTLQRVVKYINGFYEKFSNRPEAERDSKLFSVEEFDLLMPTERAYFDEIRLCQAILDHSEARMSDSEIKAVLDAFVESHLWVYERGMRRPKAGEDVWTNCPLVYVYHPENDKIGFTCSAVQSWLIYLLHEGENLRVLRLNDDL